jgi:hypothetical protein
MRIYSGLWPIFMRLLAADLNSLPWASGYGASTPVLGRSNNVHGACFLSADSWRYVGPAPFHSATILRAKVRTLIRRRTGMWDHWSHKPSHILASRVAGLQSRLLRHQSRLNKSFKVITRHFRKCNGLKRFSIAALQVRPNECVGVGDFNVLQIMSLIGRKRHFFIVKTCMILKLYRCISR